MNEACLGARMIIKKEKQKWGHEVFFMLMDCSMPGFPVITLSQSLLKLMSIELVMPSNHLILLSPSPPAFNLSQHRGPFQ